MPAEEPEQELLVEEPERESVSRIERLGERVGLLRSGVRFSLLLGLGRPVSRILLYPAIHLRGLQGPGLL